MGFQRSPELEAVMRRIWKVFASGSIEAMSNMVSTNPDVRFILSADDNWIAGSENLLRIMSGRSNLLDIERVEFDRLEAFEIDEVVGWGACNVTLFYRSGDSESLRSTIIFAVEDGVWKAVQLHTSVGVTEEETFGAELAAGLKELINSLTPTNTAAIAEVAGTSGTVTLMFTDIENSTRLAAERGDATWTQDIQDHFNSVSKIVENNAGKMVKTLGDGTMAAFPTARNAADAAITIEEGTETEDFRVRIGIHTGEAVPVGDDYAGLAVAKAARITSAADGGEILVSSVTRELLDRFDYSFATERVAELKGLDGTHRLFPLISTDTIPTR
jgi:adenylate cyclase